MSLALWVEATRPKTLPASISPILIGTALAYPRINLIALFCALLTGMSLQIGANLANDYFDYKKGADTDVRKGPRRMLQSGLISPKAMKISLFLTFFLAALSTAYLIYIGGPLIVFLLALGIFLAIGYTAKPLSISYRGLGELVVFLVFGPLAVCSSYFLQTRSFSSEILLASVAPGLLGAAILLVNNIRDVNEDCLTGKKTLAVRWGKKTCQKLYFLCMLTPPLLPLFFSNRYVSLTSLVLIPSILLCSQMQKERNMNQLLERTGKVLFLYSILFSCLWILFPTN